MNSNNEEQVIDGLFQELRRGTIVISVLSQLNKPQYGYSLVMSLEENGLQIEPGTLYPLLRRLEKQGLLTSNWDTEQSKPRKYYEISEFGITIYHKLCKKWNELVTTMSHFINKEEVK